jgi:hypothetical protein
MVRCSLCNDLVKRDEEDARLAFDFTPRQLVRSAFDEGCESCLVILEGLWQSQTQHWSLQCDVRRVYARCNSRRGAFQDTLRLEVYYEDDRPKLELEYYSLQPHRKLLACLFHRAKLTTPRMEKHITKNNDQRTSTIYAGIELGPEVVGTLQA